MFNLESFGDWSSIGGRRERERREGERRIIDPIRRLSARYLAAEEETFVVLLSFGYTF